MVTHVYNDESYRIPGKYTMNNRYGTWTYPWSSDLIQLNRVGVRRPKPKNLDFSPYEIYKVSAIPARGTWSTDHAKPTRQMYAGTVPISVIGNARLRLKHTGKEIDHNIADVARLRALVKMNNSDLDLGTAFKELGKTADLVGGLALTSVRLLRAARKGDVRAFKHTLETDTSHRLPAGNAAVDAYLAYQYGIKPTMKDIDGMLKTLTRGPPEQWLIRAKGAYANERTKYASQVQGGSAYVDSVSHLRESNRCVISALRRQLTRGEDLRWALGLDNVASTLWEITPWSFVYDWLFPVGDWLQAVNASKYYTNWSVCSTHYIREKTTVTSTPSKTISGVYYTGAFTGESESLYIKRTASSGFPFTTIPLVNPVSLDHMAKGLSLLASTLARGGEPPRYLRY